jgi:hypothetical protein
MIDADHTADYWSVPLCGMLPPHRELSPEPDELRRLYGFV